MSALKVQEALDHIFSHPDYTVGNGITPFQPYIGAQTLTAGQEFRLTLKIWGFLSIEAANAHILSIFIVRRSA